MFISVEDISTKLSDLTSCSDDLLRRYEILNSDLTVSKNCNRLLTEKFFQLERNVVSNIQYHLRESLEINPVPASISDDFLENSVCSPVNPLRKSNVILPSYFGNLRKLLSANVDVT